MERGVSAAEWTRQNIAQMRAQLVALGLSFDWDRELTTCSPEYYKWTQWLFLRLHRAGHCLPRGARTLRTSTLRRRPPTPCILLPRSAAASPRACPLFA